MNSFFWIIITIWRIQGRLCLRWKLVYVLINSSVWHILFLFIFLLLVLCQIIALYCSIAFSIMVRDAPVQLPLMFLFWVIRRPITSFLLLSEIYHLHKNFNGKMLNALCSILTGKSVLVTRLVSNTRTTHI